MDTRGRAELLKRGEQASKTHKHTKKSKTEKISESQQWESRSENEYTSDATVAMR